MDSQEVGRLLEGCLRAAAEAAAHQSTQSSEAHRTNYCHCRDSLCEELASLLQEAIEMKWPFVPEKWQYKQSVSANDKTNLSDLISKHLPQLLDVLKASIMAQEARSALSVVFLVDRFLYWTDESSRLLKITRLLHRHHPATPIAPQLVIRQARVYLNSGKLQKAEYILSNLINNDGTTGCWIYQSESDRVLVQAVSVQVRGMILQKLGLWLEAAELIWASLVGFYSLPQPDKKGIGTSLGLLANILVSMNDEDFRAFRTNPDIDFESLLGDGSHRLLSAAQAAKMAAVYSQYTSLYVLTNVTAQGTCLLSYSFSVKCPASQRQTFLMEAKEAFAIGLLTKEESDLVTSKQELHTFLKAAYSLTVAHKWLDFPSEVVTQAEQACQKGLAYFYDYCNADTQEKDSLCTEIMHLVAQVKHLLQVEPFPNSDKGSFIPDSYRNIKDTSVKFTSAGFSKIMKRFQKYHASVCETNSTNHSATKDECHGAKLCITAFGTTISSLNTDCCTETGKVLKDTPRPEKPQQRGSAPSDGYLPLKANLCTTLESSDSLGSSWQNFSSSNSGSPRPSSSGYPGSIAIGHGADMSNHGCLTTKAADDGSESMSQSAEKNKKQNLQAFNSSVGSHRIPRSAIPATSSSSGGSDSVKYELIQAAMETLGTDEDWVIDVVGVGQKLDVAERSVQSLSQVTLKTSSSSLSDSFSSLSSWEKIPANPNETKVDPEPVKPAAPLNLSREEQCAITETSTESSFEMLELNQSGHQHNNVTNTENGSVPQRKNPLCYSCLNHITVSGVVPAGQFLLSQWDYRALLAGVCHECLLKRLHSDKTFKLKKHRTSYSALHLKFSMATGLWTARETCVYIGEPMGEEGKQRTAIWVQFLHQEERLSSYVGKDYLNPKEIQFHLKDVERQMRAQYYVTEFNRSLYDKEVMAQIFFIPSEALLILEGDEIVGCVTVEPYMLGDFVKLTNNTGKKDMRYQATEYGIAFGHFTYLFSNGQEVVVDLQGWVTANGKGLTYLTDPQIHSTRIPKGFANFADRGLRYFVEEQHGLECNGICKLLELPLLTTRCSSEEFLSC